MPHWALKMVNSGPMQNQSSNHPKHVIKQIHVGINKRLCAISCDKEHFDRAKPEYEKALKDSGHKVDLKFLEV